MQQQKEGTMARSSLVWGGSPVLESIKWLSSALMCIINLHSPRLFDSFL